MKAFLHLKSVDEVEKMIFALPMLGSEEIPIENAVNRRLAFPFYAPSDLPGFRRATMDGYAVKATDVFGASENNPALLHVAKTCEIGHIPDFILQNGDASPISTGAPLPDGADAVVMLEHTRSAGSSYIEIIRSIAPGTNLVEKDEDARQGQALMEPGQILRPQEIGILAAFGKKTVTVYKKARIAIISTGDELVDIDIIPANGQIRDVNSWSLAALCQTAGSEVSKVGIIKDDLGLLCKTIASLSDKMDVILVSGGSSAGMRDHTIEAFKSLPDSRLLAHGVAMSPGKPFILAIAKDTCLVGLPGHVASALVCAHVFLLPLLQHLQGLSKPTPKAWIEATLSRSIASTPGRRAYIRCKLEKKGDNYMAIPLVSHSAVLESMLEANGFIICSENSEGLYQNQNVKVYPFQNC